MIYHNLDVSLKFISHTYSDKCIDNQSYAEKNNRFFRKQIDTIVYGIIGTFSILFIIPKFFLQLERQMGIDLNDHVFLKFIGIIFMNAGGILAIWCTILMYKSRKATPSPFTIPKKIITTGPFKYVRHPMMWSLNFVIIGQIFAWHSLMILIWFLIWLRFSVIYISRYEEPYLTELFGEEYIEYCRNTPRWIPKIGKHPKEYR